MAGSNMDNLSFPTRIERLLAVAALLIVAGCSDSSRFSDIRTFMDEVNARPTGQIAPLPEFEPYQPYSYGAADRRSPFEPPVIISPKSQEQRDNVGIKPPKDHVKQFLERFNLASLSMVGTLSRENTMFALVNDGEGIVHRVQVGDYMGANWGLVESISDARLDITEIVSDGQGGWLRRPHSIELKGGE